MIGISDTIANRYSEADLQRIFGPWAHKGEIRVRYARPNGDLTSPLPSSRHLSYVSKGWMAVEIVEPEEAVESAPVVVPDAILEHGRHDRVGLWERGSDALESSCRNAFSLIGKGWAFVALADEDRRRALAEARPFPKAPAASATANTPTVPTAAPVAVSQKAKK